MKAILLSVLVLSSGVAAEYPAQKINRADSVRFGQTQAEIERMLKAKAVPDNSGIGRPNKDFVLSHHGIKLEFDSGRLENITFNAEFDFNIPIVAFIESWRNLDAIGGIRITSGIKKPNFLEYLAAWEARAKKLGIRRYDGNELLKEGEYSVRATEQKFMDMIHISFGPERSTGKGGSWGSGCSIFFLTPDEASLYGRKPGTVDTISVTCDEFNTHARQQ